MRNNRIMYDEVLNQRCAFKRDLESILLVVARKILFRQYRSNTDLRQHPAKRLLVPRKRTLAGVGGRSVQCRQVATLFLIVREKLSRARYLPRPRNDISGTCRSAIPAAARISALSVRAPSWLCIVGSTSGRRRQAGSPGSSS